MTKRKVLSIFFGFSGVVLISITQGNVVLDNYWQIFGIGLLMISNVSAGVGNMMVSGSSRNLPFLELNCIQLFFGGFLLLLLSFLLEGFHWTPKEPAYYFSLAWLSFISAAALSIWFNLLRSQVLVSDLNIWKFIIPVSGACLSWIFVKGETPEVYSVSGMILIVIALFILNFGRK